MWDQRYSEQPYAYGTAPNAFVKASLDTQKPGKILFEIEGLPENEAKEALTKASAKLPLKTSFVKELL